MAVCNTLIAENIAVNCSDMVVRGLEADGLIINRDQIDFASSVVADNIISTLTLKTSCVAYEVVQQGATPFTGTQTALVVGTNRNTWENTVALVVLGNNPDVNDDIIDPLGNGNFVVILKNKNTASKGKYQVYGWYQGLRASEITSEKYSEDTDGGWAVNLTESQALKSAMYFYNTDDATTDTAYEALKGS